MPPAASPNFAFLAHHDPRLVVLGTQAERYFAEDPNTCLVKLRQFGEILAQRAAARLGLYTSPEDNQATLINRLRERGALDATTRQLFHDLRVAGNKATHELRGEHHEALHQLKMARELAVWFQRSFGNNRKFDPGPFVPPPDPAKEDASLAAELEKLRGELARSKVDLARSKVDIEAARAAAEEEAKRRLTAEERARKEAEDRAILEALAIEAEQQWAKDVEAIQRQKAQLAAELAALQAQAAQAPAAEIQAVVDRAAEAAQAVRLDEAATRRIIDEQLRNAGWEVDSEHLRFERGSRPEKGKNRAIAEWPTASGPADYVLFVGPDAMAVIEAKRKRKDVAGAIEQAKRYSRGFVAQDGAAVPGGPWGKDRYKVPFLFATNGRPYLKQIAEKSGIWFRDARRDDHHARALPGWYSPEGLAALLKQDVALSHAKLHGEPTDYLGLRDYQIRAIQAVEAAIEAGQPACLVAMATGTGKTRTAIAAAAPPPHPRPLPPPTPPVEGRSPRQAAEAMRQRALAGSQRFLVPPSPRPCPRPVLLAAVPGDRTVADALAEGQPAASPRAALGGDAGRGRAAAHGPEPRMRSAIRREAVPTPDGRSALRSRGGPDPSRAL